MSASNSAPRRVIISCIFLSVFLNFYLYHDRSILEVNCIIDSETLINFTKNHENRLEHASRIKKSVDRTVPQCVKTTNFPTTKTLQIRLYAFPIGNKLFELISLLGIASILQRTPTIDVVKPEYVTTFVKSIQPIFPKLLDQYDLRILPPNSTISMKANDNACCKFDDPKKLLNVTVEHLYLHGNYFQSYKYFDHLRSKIREWLAPTNLATSLAGMLFPQNLRGSFVVCPHVRRGDFKTDGVHEPSDATFTRSAVDFLVNQYKQSHKQITVAVLGNDQQFAYTIFQDKFGNSSSPIPNSYNFTIPTNSPTYQVLVSPSFTPELDLAFSRSFCDATLITAPSSTFGWWLSYLSKPSSVTYYRNIRETNDKVANEMIDEDFFLPNWIKLQTGENGVIIKVK
ncbi:hypothetical protein GCK72_019579 [Caenorhabditis remanei]|uniref:Uncharacterized protein n=1 Tax=Caenorhabditis remanei TaxID=31234 RepID=A0A6A5GEC5_CAERE|nr:hypothetical protein GCK72_019579 [Caenorhabditis remanei]KAF1753023.1 hypothetical protein GCK72_019579 [Caenorhabditis remanei]